MLTGKTAIITGGNSGIGFETAKGLLAIEARVILAVRNTEKGNRARAALMELHPSAQIDVMKLDLADLESIQAFAEEFRNAFDKLDILINNAGIMAPPYSKTRDGFELQFGSNHLGHFALTGLLMPLLANTPGSRVVTVSSRAHSRGSVDFANLDGSKGYQAKKFYNQSKLANLYFAMELDKRLKENGLQTISVACHPGVSATNILKFGQREIPTFFKSIANLFLQPPDMGALATIYAAVDAHLTGGEYIGPVAQFQRRGYPALGTPHANATDQEISLRLWEVSENLTAVSYDFERLE
ncbi:NAD(P)-dependent dehydrogenase (short-subunit alcohol dehydrogenase family) [Planomicrobium stackebrandtii]|uniref:NAD(P)-dependent dehydrogenase (Short-subunit alcohol dehydrogenase family) n=1 Tax=Planomicrobium stackebrandtii TaxID=253160 RepID=A0ABU0GTI7_9BACL|nr:oxidoreductase [Planomicrobium stackebrandtii]MDQ0428670.1 NAD(P)-dependent dehydrogenase (short-subunit alcohol dehydrogenase family) [Planomicrobium stackebrandtii]